MSRPLPLNAARRALMQRVRQAKTAPEERVAETLRSIGIRYRRNTKQLPGAPDFSNAKRRWAIFVNGCYWHRHTNCVRATLPKHNQLFWADKFSANRQRDARKVRELRKKGFRVSIVWECEVADSSALRRRLSDIFEPCCVGIR